MMNLRLTNNFLAYIIPSIIQPFNIILIKTYIESTPVELQEAAEIDGAGIFYIFWRIILPISKPILATVGIFAAVGQWNSFMDTLLLVTNPKLFSLQFMLYRFLNEARSLASLMRASTGGSTASTAITAAARISPMSLQMTCAVVIVFPVLLVYPLFQRFFVKGIMMGAVKG
jgi:putative aldouronate transport system permease protein